MSDETWTETHRETLRQKAQGMRIPAYGPNYYSNQLADLIDAALAEIARLTAENADMADRIRELESQF